MEPVRVFAPGPVNDTETLEVGNLRAGCKVAATAGGSTPPPVLRVRETSRLHRG